MEKTLAVALMVKSESKTILRCLESVKNIADMIIVSDTGSTDSTSYLIASFCIEHNIKYYINEDEWIDFGSNRTKLLQFAKDKSDYALLLDADMTVTLNNFDKENLTASAYYLRYNGNLDYSQMLLINNRLNWCYEGVTHEYIKSLESFIFTENLNSITINHYHDGANRKDKFERDIQLLLKGIEKDQNNSRYHFYLAQSYKDIGEYEKAIEYYKKRIELKGWVEEIFYSLYQIGYCREMSGNLAKAKLAYISAWEFRPTRAESLYRLALVCKAKEEYNQAYLYVKKALEIPYPKDLLFIDKPVYETLLKEEKEYLEYKLFGYRIFNKKAAMKALGNVSKTFQQLGLQFFLTSGTLLGFVRNYDFIDHDLDIDLGILGDSNIEIIKNKLVENGFEFKCYFGKKGESLEYRFFYDGIQVDLFCYYDEGSKCYLAACDNKGKTYKYYQDKFKILETIFYNVPVGIPNNPEKYLETQYGKDWRTPKKNWDYIKDAINIKKMS
jgi:tetratricopeptide (TPR) repeat protein